MQTVFRVQVVPVQVMQTVFFQVQVIPVRVMQTVFTYSGNADCVFQVQVIPVRVMQTVWCFFQAQATHVGVTETARVPLSLSLPVSG